MSTYADPRSAHDSSRVLRCIEVDGKPTAVPNRNTATATSSVAEWFAQLAPFNRVTSLLRFSSQSRCFAPLCDYPAWTKSTLLTLSNGTPIRAPSRAVLKLLSLHELSSSLRSKPLTRAGPAGYAGIQKGGSRCGDSAARASGSVPGALENQGREHGS